MDCKEIKPVHPKGNQSWIFIGRLMLKLKLQYSGHRMQTTDSLEKTLMLGKIEGRRRRGLDVWMASLTQWTWVWANSGIWWWTGSLACRSSWGSQSRTWLRNWTEQSNKSKRWVNLQHVKHEETPPRYILIRGQRKNLTSSTPQSKKDSSNTGNVTSKGQRSDRS